MPYSQCKKKTELEQVSLTLYNKVQLSNIN